MFFIKVTNLSFTREVEIDRIWFTTVPTIEVLAQPLPKRLRPDELWETWEPVSSLPNLELPYAEYRVRVRLTSGKEVPSRAGRSVAPRGYVAGTSQR